MEGARVVRSLKKYGCSYFCLFVDTGSCGKVTKNGPARPVQTINDWDAQLPVLFIPPPPRHPPPSDNNTMSGSALDHQHPGDNDMYGLLSLGFKHYHTSDNDTTYGSLSRGIKHYHTSDNDTTFGSLPRDIKLYHTSDNDTTFESISREIKRNLDDFDMLRRRYPVASDDTTSGSHDVIMTSICEGIDASTQCDVLKDQLRSSFDPRLYDTYESLPRGGVCRRQQAATVFGGFSTISPNVRQQHRIRLRTNSPAASEPECLLTALQRSHRLNCLLAADQGRPYSDTDVQVTGLMSLASWGVGAGQDLPPSPAPPEASNVNNLNARLLTASF